MVLDVFVIFDLDRLVTLGAKLGLVNHQLVDACFAKDYCTILVVAHHRGPWQALAVITAEVLQKYFVHFKFPGIFRRDSLVRYQVVLISLVDVAKSVLLFGVAEMAVLEISERSL